MKMIEVVAGDRTLLINVEEVAYVECANEPTPCAAIYLRGVAPDGKPPVIHLSGGDAASFVGKLRVAASVY